MNNEVKKLKVFQMNDVDCFADYSKEEAITHYVEQLGMDVDDIDVNEVTEFTEEELEKLSIVFIDEEGHPTITFKEHLQNFTKPDFFSSTEY